MLDQNDLNAIAQLMQQFEQRMDGKLGQLEQRMDDKFAQQEKRIDDKFAQQKDCIINEAEDRIVSKINAIIETKVLPQIQLIAEQHSDIIDRLSAVKEVDSLKGRVSTLETVVQSHSDELEKLKKAQ